MGLALMSFWRPWLQGSNVLQRCALCCLGVLLQKDDGPLTVRSGFSFSSVFFSPPHLHCGALRHFLWSLSAGQLPSSQASRKLLFVLQTALFGRKEKSEKKGREALE